MVGLTQIEGDETGIMLTLRHDAFFYIEQQQSVEVQQTCLEHTHDLDIRGRFAMERHRDGLHHAADEQT